MKRKNRILLLCLALMLVGMTACEKPQHGDDPKVIDLSKLTSDIILEDKMVLTDTLDGEKQQVKISIADGATVILNNACIKGVNIRECEWAGLTCLGDATIIISGKNKVSGFSVYFPGISVPKGKTLILKATNTPESFYDEDGERLINDWDKDCVDTLYVSGHVMAAAIGGIFFDDCGSIEIWGGTYYLSSDEGACIGSAFGSSCEDILIEGGHIFADADYYPAAIGSGEMGQCGDIIIRGGQITAKADTGAAIGSGKGGCFKSITIENTFDYIKVVTGSDKGSIPIGKGEDDQGSGDVNIAGVINPGRLWRGDGLPDEVWFRRDGILPAGTWEMCGIYASPEW